MNQNSLDESIDALKANQIVIMIFFIAGILFMVHMAYFILTWVL